MWYEEIICLLNFVRLIAKYLCIIIRNIAIDKKQQWTKNKIKIQDNEARSDEQDDEQSSR